MGQYYSGIVLKKDYKTTKNNPTIVGLHSWDFENGQKLMEHSYIGNYYVNAVMKLIAIYKGYPFVWCGDYADEIFKTKNDESANAYMLAHIISPAELTKRVIENKVEEDYKYIVNYSKREYIKVPDYEKDKWTIHPLPLLCADGNGRGSGDYCGINVDKVGIWAYNRIGVTNKRPHYKRIHIEFEEND